MIIRLNRKMRVSCPLLACACWLATPLLPATAQTPGLIEPVITKITLKENDLPLAVENIITPRGQLLFDATLSYANVERDGIAVGEPFVIQTDPTSFVTLPPVVGPSEINSDTLVTTFGLRYGIGRRAELYVRASALHANIRGVSFDRRYSSTTTRFADSWIGGSYQFTEDQNGPAIIAFAETALSERLRVNTRSFRSVLFGLTTYKAFDPVVLAASIAYRHNMSRRDGAGRYNPGDFLTIRPTIGFAVNDRVTLTTGFQWTRTTTDRLDGVVRTIERTGTDIVLGTGYGLPNNSSLNFTVETNASGRSGADLRLNWLRPF
jgi:hypothetical protein